MSTFGMKLCRSILSLLLLALACLAGPARAGSCCQSNAARAVTRAIAGDASLAPTAADRHGCAPDCTGCGCGCRHRNPRDPGEPPSALPASSGEWRRACALDGVRAPVVFAPPADDRVQKSTPGRGPPSSLAQRSLLRSHRILPLRI